MEEILKPMESLLLNTTTTFKRSGLCTSLVELCQNEPSPGWEEVFTLAMPDVQHAENMINTRLQVPGAYIHYFPLLNQVFTAFDECPLNNVKVVILGQDPYHAVNPNGTPQAIGMSFATRRGTKVQPSLANIYKELAMEYPDFKIPNHGDLTSWAQQGVLLLNTTLTVKPHMANSHSGIWRGFIARVLNAINNVNPRCIYLLWGRDAHDYISRLSERSIKLKATHPSPLSANRASRDTPAFIGCRHFILANEYLVAQGQTPINWNIPA